MKSSAMIVVLLATAVSFAQGQNRETPTCTANDMGEMTMHNAPTQTIACMRIRRDNVDKTAKMVVEEDGGDMTCALEQKPEVTSYIAAEIDTGVYCKFECRRGVLACLDPPGASDTHCKCTETTPRAVLIPLPPDEATRLIIQESGGRAPANACSGKEEGYVLPAEVPCTVFSTEYPAELLTETIPGLCRNSPHPKAGDTRETLAAVPSGGQVCRYTCKQGPLLCNGEDVGGFCECSRHLMPRLELAAMARVARTAMRDDGSTFIDEKQGCTSNIECGLCGVCLNGRCEPREDMATGDYCPCGQVCELTSQWEARKNLPGARNSPVECVTNPALDGLPCLKDPGNGTEKPNICKASAEGDFLDQCVCAEGYFEQWGPYQQDQKENTCHES